MTKEILECEYCGHVQIAPEEGLWKCLACGAPLPMPEDEYAENDGSDIHCASTDGFFTTDACISFAAYNQYNQLVRFPKK